MHLQKYDREDGQKKTKHVYQAFLQCNAITHATNTDPKIKMTVDDIGNIYLVGTNVFIIPAVICAAYLDFKDLASLYTTTAIVSTVYHLCQAEFICAPLAFELLQIADLFFVYLTLVWTVMWFTDTFLQTRIVILWPVSAVLLIAILYFCFSKWFMLISVVFLTLLLVILLVASPQMRIFWPALVVAVVLFGMGILLHIVAGSPGDTSYPFAHGTSHPFFFSSLLFLLIS